MSLSRLEWDGSKAFLNRGSDLKLATATGWEIRHVALARYLRPPLCHHPLASGLFEATMTTRVLIVCLRRGLRHVSCRVMMRSRFVVNHAFQSNFANRYTNPSKKTWVITKYTPK